MRACAHARPPGQWGLLEDPRAPGPGQAVVCGILLKDLFAERKPASVLLLPAAALLCAVFGFYFSRFLPIHAAEQARIAAIEAAMDAGEAQVVIPAFPYQDYLWNPDVSIGKQYYYIEPDDFLILVENTGA